MPTNKDAHKVRNYQASASPQMSNSTTNSQCETLQNTYPKLSHIPVPICVESNSSPPTTKEKHDHPKTFTLKAMESSKDPTFDATENQKDQQSRKKRLSI